jgi:hypothetical protein
MVIKSRRMRWAQSCEKRVLRMIENLNFQFNIVRVIIIELISMAYDIIYAITIISIYTYDDGLDGRNMSL